MVQDDEITPIGRWLVRQCEQMIDPKTGKSITWRQASLRAGFHDPNAIWRVVRKHQTPDPDSCYKLATFFHEKPAVVLRLAGHVHLVEDAEPPQPQPTQDELYEVDPELYNILLQVTSHPDPAVRRQVYDAIKAVLKIVMGKS